VAEDIVVLSLPPKLWSSMLNKDVVLMIVW